MPMSDGDSAKIGRQTAIAAFIVGVVVALVGVAMWKNRPRLERIEVSQQTTYIITPTRADGWVDYPEAVDWMRRASLDAGGANATVSLLRALGRDALPAGSDRGALLERLKITDAGDDASVLKPLATFTGPDAPSTTEPPPATMQWLWARCGAAADAKLPLARIRGWLAQAEGALANLREAAHGAALYVPVSRGRHVDGIARVNGPLLADAAHALGCAAAVKLLQGDAPASWADVDALWRLGQLLARAASVSEYGIALEIWQTAKTATVDLVASPAASPVLLSAMAAGLSAKLGFSPATETWMFQRLAVLEANGTPLVPLPRSGAQSGGPYARAGTAAKLEAINQAFDDVDVALQVADPKQRIARVDQLAQAVAAPGGISGAVVLGVEIQAVSCHRLATLAVALARRQRDGGKLPASLAELGGDLPKDPGSGGSFVYKPDGRQFLVYGVGGNGRDDGGDAIRDVVATAHEPPLLAAPSP